MELNLGVPYSISTLEVFILLKKHCAQEIVGKPEPSNLRFRIKTKRKLDNSNLMVSIKERVANSKSSILPFVPPF